MTEEKPAPAKKTRGKGKAKAHGGDDIEDKKPSTSVKWSVKRTLTMLNGFLTAKMEGWQAQSGWPGDERARIANEVLKDSHLTDGGLKRQ